ncbi:hypothetical protein ACO0LF_18160 [Undibacterium sp. Di27W]|uniref:hypothetical protein n=1 Tax=Undibacterium sp. Di27W TaxID=3413036 RepID=UPI003BF34E2B
MTTVDPNDILFSVPTLSNELATLLPVTVQPTAADFLLHEDEWEQMEFFAGERVDEVQATLQEYHLFEAEHRAEVGWRKAYLRQLARTTVLNLSVAKLAAALGGEVGPAPLLYYGNTLSGQVQDGFSITVGGNVSLYGYSDAHGIPVLGVNMGPEADNNKLVAAFSYLHANHGLILVDWRSQMLLRAANAAGQLDIWRP